MDFKQKKEQIDARFNKAKKQIDAFKLKAQELNQELLKLQEEWRMIESLEKENNLII